MKRIIKNLIPVTNWELKKSPNGKTTFAIWRQWFGKTSNYCEFDVSNADYSFSKMAEYLKIKH